MLVLGRQAFVGGREYDTRHRLLHRLESKIKLEATNCRHCKYNARCWAVKLYSGAPARPREAPLL